MQQFFELGTWVEDRWREQNYNDSAFSAIAAQALRECDVVSRVDPWEIIRWVHTTPSLPQQADPKGMFGNPPITLFNGPRFQVDVYFWLDGTTSIHQHAFSGAFQVLLGSSVHSHYRFHTQHEISSYFLLGQTELHQVSLLTHGMIREIDAGDEFIHSLFHLERPSATLTVRSHHDPRHGTQYSYLKPHVAYDPFFDEETLRRRTETVSLLLNMDHPRADEFIVELLARADFHTTFKVLQIAHRILAKNELEQLFEISKSADRLQKYIDASRQRHGELVDLLLPVFDEQDRETDIVQRRAKIEREDHRFFMALLLNVPERTKVLELIKARFPDEDPVKLCVKWIKELSAIRLFGSSEPNVLNLCDFDAAEFFVFDGLLQGESDEQIAARAPGEFESRTVETIRKIRSLSMFKQIFREEVTRTATHSFEHSSDELAGARAESVP